MRNSCFSECLLPYRFSFPLIYATSNGQPIKRQTFNILFYLKEIIINHVGCQSKYRNVFSLLISTTSYSFPGNPMTSSHHRIACIMIFLSFSAFLFHIIQLFCSQSGFCYRNCFFRETEIRKFVVTNSDHITNFIPVIV